MDHALAYQIINFIVMPAWALLILAPNWKFTTKVVHSAFVPLIMFLIYFYYISWTLFFGGGAEGGGFGSLESVMLAFTSPIGFLAGWVHYLAFDLFVGMWISRDGKRRDIAHAWIVPCLILTYVLGPVGLGVYLVMRKLRNKGSWSLHEDVI
ncbi:MAG: DUF4281 domain-containing protein [Acidimicrobiales bacterium]|nr:DUF4281 domain-containing protein [Hyphomonadaceae bacterium]RZV45020.1 MAG: DUF4281 domain-containing protein [Acidimicrobiales bacterium]